MSTRHEDNDGSDIFWPGYVDATTNLILNLLFLLTILMVAVFMFALELGRSSPTQPVPTQVVAIEPDVDVVPVAGIGSAMESAAVQEVIALKLEIHRLNELLAEQASRKEQTGGLIKNVDATSDVPRPLNGLDKSIASDSEIVVHFKDEAVSFTQEEHDRLLESLQTLDESGKVSVLVEVPDGFSEAKRMGFYRAMAVRNLLIEMNVPQENIDVSVVESKKKANASIVRVRSR